MEQSFRMAYSSRTHDRGEFFEIDHRVYNLPVNDALLMDRLNRIGEGASSIAHSARSSNYGSSRSSNSGQELEYGPRQRREIEWSPSSASYVSSNASNASSRYSQAMSDSRSDATLRAYETRSRAPSTLSSRSSASSRRRSSGRHRSGSESQYGGSESVLSSRSSRLADDQCSLMPSDSASQVSSRSRRSSSSRSSEHRRGRPSRRSYDSNGIEQMSGGLTQGRSMTTIYEGEPEDRGDHYVQEMRPSW